MDATAPGNGHKSQPAARHRARVELADRCADPALGMVGRHLRACLTRALADETVRGKLSVLRRLVEQLPCPAEAATADDLEAWWALRSASRAATSRAVELSHVRGFYGWLVRTGRRADDPSIRLDRVKVPRRQPRGVSRDQVARLLHELDGRNRRAVALAALCGLRAGELATARREDLMQTAAGPVLYVTGKGGRTRHVPVPARLAAELAQVSGLFVTSTRGRPITPHGVSDLLARILRGHGVNATGHKLRHHYAQQLYAATGDLLGLGRALGHSHASTTQRYAEGDTEAMRSAADALATAVLVDDDQAAEQIATRTESPPAALAAVPSPPPTVDDDDQVAEQIAAAKAAWAMRAEAEGETSRQPRHRPVTRW